MTIHLFASFVIKVEWCEHMEQIMIWITYFYSESIFILTFDSHFANATETHRQTIDCSITQFVCVCVCVCVCVVEGKCSFY